MLKVYIMQIFYIYNLHCIYKVFTFALESYK